MRKKRLLFTLGILLYCIHSYCASSFVEINGIQYALSGTSAAVVSGYDYDDNFANGKPGYMHYSNESYVIPSTIEYDGRTYTVDKIGLRAFDDENIHNPYSSKIKSIKLPSTLRYIGKGAFCGTSITEMIIPSKVETFGAYSWEGGSIFHDCDLLASLIYIPIIAPSNWVATTKTYVPDKVSYSSPFAKMNDAHIIEMISFADSIYSYTGQAPITTWTNNVEGYAASLTMPTLKKDAGSYKEIIPVTFTKGEESFTANVVYRYTIKAAHLTAKIENATREYGEDNPQITISYTGFVGDDDESSFTQMPNITTTATKTSDVGEYPITVTGGVSGNYDITYETGVLTITKAPLTAKVRDTTKTYGSPNPTFTMDYSGLKNEEATPKWTTRPTMQTDATQSSPVGQYDVIISGGVARNYDVTFGKGVLTIDKAPLKITADNKSRSYYEDNPNLTCSYSGFVNNEDATVLTAQPTLATTATTNSKVGLYPIIISGATADNYSITHESGTLKVMKRSLSVSTENYTRAYNEENPEFKVNYSGFVNGETDNALISKPTAMTTATKTSDVGTYDIVLSGGVAENYDFTYANGTLTIEKAYQTLTWNQDLSDVALYSQVELEAIASSGSPISYSLSTDSVCSLSYIGSKTYLDCFHCGKVVVEAQQEGNKNYWPTTKFYKELNVSKTTGIKSIYAGNTLKGKVSVSGDRIIVDADENAIITVSTLSGAIVYRGKSHEVRLPSGIYIVKIGNSTIKVVIK